MSDCEIVAFKDYMFQDLRYHYVLIFRLFFFFID